MEETCALDVAERGGITLEEVGGLMNSTSGATEAEALSEPGIVDLTEEDITEARRTDRIATRSMLDGRLLSFVALMSAATASEPTCSAG